MSHRPERVAHAVRDVVSEAIAVRLSDPRICRFTSVTRVEVSGDLRLADVYVSVMGTDAEGQTTMKGLHSARGLIQTMLAKRLDMRVCPVIRFHLDRGLKTAIETIRLIDKLAAEDREKGKGENEEHDRDEVIGGREGGAAGEEGPGAGASNDSTFGASA